MKFDLHIHSCLSPCANLEMSPREIVARAVKAGMQGIALTDHNSSKNCPAVAECARRAGLLFLSGLEVCTAEEIHTLTLFDTVEAAAKMTDWGYEARIKRVNDPEAFGAHCHALGGLFVAAHVDRPAFSVFSQLGAIPPEAKFDAVELSRTANEEAWLPKVSAYAATRSSDAHNLDDVARVWTSAPLQSFTIAALREAFAHHATSLSPRLTQF